jgi:hypothetical protein
MRSGALVPTDTVTEWVVLDEEFVRRSTSGESPIHVDRLLLPHRRLRRRGQSATLRTRRASPAAKRKTDARLKTSSGRPGGEPGTILTQINDFPAVLPAGGITYLRAPRRRFEIQTRTLFDDVRFVSDPPTTEVGHDRTHVLAMNIRLFTFQRALDSRLKPAVADPKRSPRKRLQPLTADALVIQSQLPQPPLSGLRSPHWGRE